MNSPVRLGIISALHEEQDGLLAAMQDRQSRQIAGRTYTAGRLWDVDSVCVLSRIGKVGASATACMLVAHYNVSHILFTGVAGGADPALHVGDIVLAQELVQHDMNAEPLFPRYQIPLTGITRFAADAAFSEILQQACSDFLREDFLQMVSAQTRDCFQLRQVQCVRGLIASGDEFINSSTRLAQLKQAFPDLLAVEMEGAALAQVCHEFGIPLAVMRSLSDGANESAAHDFTRFTNEVAARYAQGVVRRLCQRLAA
ncbi:5'-methylthioadenosine/adenosylhomocysteine nucleosidase [Massilia sp. W12]|uniref:5'-methylthioadenosine/adenosylhomocysteine nucleosidase n=1 Tax=Massilia sp. W12 TaxID=3126507 RepID=UPI0030CB1C19